VDFGSQIVSTGPYTLGLSRQLADELRECDQWAACVAEYASGGLTALQLVAALDITIEGIYARLTAPQSEEYELETSR
jgi:hypothetical protein